MAEQDSPTVSADISQVLEHPDVPGVLVFLFSDGTAIVADSNGQMSPVQKASEEDFTSLGWTVQDE